MSNFYVIFGQRYDHEPHPSGIGFTPDGLLKVISTDYGTAREDVFNAIGTAWAFIYDEANARHPSFRGLYGKGVTHVLENGEIKPVDK